MKAKVLFFLLFMLILKVNSTKAAVYTWTGLAAPGWPLNFSSNWNNQANWVTPGPVLGLPVISGYPGAGDVAVFNDLLIPYTVSLGTATTCSQIICNSLLSFGAAIDTKGFALTVTNSLVVGSNPLLSLGGLLTILGSGPVTINSAVTLGSTVLIGVLNCGSPSDHTTNVTIQNAAIGLNGPNVLSAISLLGGPSIINNYGSLTIAGSTANFGVESLLVNNSSGTVSVTNSTLNLNNDLASVLNYGSFGVGGSTSTTTNFNLSAGTNGIYNYGTFNAGTSTSVCNMNLSGGASALLTVSLNLGNILGVSLIVLPGTGPAINNYGTFNAGTTSSVCNINLTGTSAPLVNNSNNGTTSYGAFNLSSVSVIFPTSSTAKVVNNSPNCVFTLLSDKNGSATISRVTAGATITGMYNVQRFITGNSSITYRGYRLLSPPVNITSPTSSASGTNYIPMSTLNSTYTVAGTAYHGAFIGGTGSGFNVYNPNPTIYFYKEYLPFSNSTFTSGQNQGVTSIVGNQVTLTDGKSYNIPVGNGYILFFIGSTLGRTSGATTQVPDNAYITNVGYINQQNVKVNLWYTPAGGALKLSRGSTTQAIGCNMVGNPYPATLDLNTVYNDNKGTNGISQIFYQYYDKIHDYVSYNAFSGATSGAGASQYVASGQGFFVIANTASSTLTFNENEKTPVVTNPSPIILGLKKAQNLALAKSSSTLGNSLATNSETAPVLAGLHLKMQKDSLTFQECGIYFNSTWSDNYDYNDAAYLAGGSGAVVFYSLTADGHAVGINSMGSYTTGSGQRAKLYVKASANGIYSMQMEDCLNLDTLNYRIYLVDHFLKDSVNLVTTKSYAFTITNSDTSSFGSNRFELAVEKKPGPPYQLASFTGQKVTNGVQLSWKTSNEGTYTNFSVEKQGATDNQFNSIYSVQGDGSGAYSYIDRNPVTGNNIYRLAQKDANNVITYSNTVTIVYNSAASSGLVNVYPNPAKESITVGFNSATNGINGNYQANIYNSLGAPVMNQAISGNSWTQNVSALKPGTYIIEVRADNGSLIGSSKFSKAQ